MLKHGEGLRASSQPRSLAPSIVKRTGPPFPSCSSFLAFLSFKGEQQKRSEREGERSDERNTILMGRAKKRIEER